MAGPISGRKVRIKYYATGFGGSGVEVARAQTDSGTINREHIESTTKDSGAWRDYLNELGVMSMDLTVSGILSDQHKTLVGLAADDSVALHSFELDIDTVGTFRATYVINSFEIGGNHGAETATFSMSLASGGEVTWAAAV